MKKRGPAIAWARASDDETAESIVGELSLDPSIEKSQAVNEVKRCIEDVRETFAAAGLEPWPSKAKETIEQIAKHAEALAACIEKLSPNWRWYLSLSVFNERNDEGIPIIDNRPGVDSDRTARTRMGEWIDHLKRIPHDFGRMQNSRRDFFHGPQALCAFKARELILALAPTTEFKKGESSKFNSITSKLWEAATGKQQSMKNSCDDNVDLFRRMQRAVEEQDLAPGAGD